MDIEEFDFEEHKKELTKNIGKKLSQKKLSKHDLDTMFLME